jgi:hypothetical protein
VPCSVPRSQRGGEVVEPLVSEQWFVRMGPLAEPALAAVANGDIKIVPERFEKIYNGWLENIKVCRVWAAFGPYVGYMCRGIVSAATAHVGGMLCGTELPYEPCLARAPVAHERAVRRGPDPV